METKNLLSFPCLIGDPIWKKDRNGLSEYKVTKFSFRNMEYDCISYNPSTDDLIIRYASDDESFTGTATMDKIGKTIFFSKKDADAAIAAENAEKFEKDKTCTAKIYILERDNPYNRPEPEPFTDYNTAMETAWQEFRQKNEEFKIKNVNVADGPSGWHFIECNDWGYAAIWPDNESTCWYWRITRHDIGMQIEK